MRRPDVTLTIETHRTPIGWAFHATGAIGEIRVRGQAQVTNEVPSGLHHYVVTDLARHITGRLLRGHRLLTRLRST